MAGRPLSARLREQVVQGADEVDIVYSGLEETMVVAFDQIVERMFEDQRIEQERLHRLAQEEAERKRKAEEEAERRRQADLEAERRRQAEEEAEKERKRLEAERQRAEQGGFVPVRMGPRVMRTETAPIAALAAIQALWGDFR